MDNSCSVGREQINLAITVCQGAESGVFPWLWERQLGGAGRARGAGCWRSSGAEGECWGATVVLLTQFSKCVCFRHEKSLPSV